MKRTVDFLQKNKIISVFICLILILTIVFLCRSNVSYASELDYDDYNCDSYLDSYGDVILTTDEIAEENGGYLCYVTAGVSGVCPADAQAAENGGELPSINGCTTESNTSLQSIFANLADTSLYNLTSIYSGDFYIYTSSSTTTTEVNACLLRNYVNTPDEDTTYYGYYNSACVCYGSVNNNSYCQAGTSWLNETPNPITSTSIYRYYIETQSKMVCEDGDPIVIGSDSVKGDLYACSVGKASVNTKTLTVNFSFEDDDMSKESVSDEFYVYNGGNDTFETSILTDDSTESYDDIIDSGYELSEITCSDTAGYEYVGDLTGNIFTVDGSSLDDSVEFMKDITCTVAFTKKRYTVEVSLSDESTGSATITDSENTVKYNDGVDVAVSAASNSKYVSTTCATSAGATVATSATTNSAGIDTGVTINFSEVTDDVKCEVTVNERDKYVVEAEVSGSGGTVSPTTQNVYEGNTASITAIPSDGYALSSAVCVNTNNASDTYSVSISGNTIKIKDVITSNVSCTVTFTEVDYTVTIDDDPDGSAESISIIYDDDETDVTPNLGEVAKVTVVPSDGYKYVSNTCGTSGADIVGTSNSDGSYTFAFTVTGDKSCVVYLEKISYDVTTGVTPTGGGTATASSSTVEYGDDAKITVSASTGYEYSSHSCTVDGKSVSSSIASNVITVSDVTGDVYCSVTFVKKTYSVSTSVTPTGSGTAIASSSTVSYGDDVTISVTPSTGYEYSSHSCTVGGTAVTGTYSNGVITLSNVTGNTSCTVTFKKISYDVEATVSPDEGGNATPSSSTVDYGDSAKITVSANTGYEYSSHSCTVGGVAASGSYSGGVITVSNVTGDVSCEVVFALSNYTVSVSSNNTSYGNVEQDKTVVTKEDTVKVTITPEAGYKYVSNDCGGTINADNTLLTISNVTSNKVCVVNFEAIDYTVTAVGDGGGTVSPSSNGTTYGGSVEFTITPDTNYKYVSNDCGATLEDANTLVVSNVTSDVVCIVSFAEKDKYTVTAVGINGTATPESQSVYEGGNAVISITADENYVYDSNDCGAVINSDGTKLTLTSVSSNTTCNVTFREKDKYTVTVSSENENYGTVTPESGEVYDGGSFEINVSVTPGNEYKSITCNGSVVEDAIFNDGVVTISNITENLTCVVNFKDVEEYTVTAEVNDSEMGSVTPDTQTTGNGGSASIVVSANDGYEYSSVTCNDEVLELELVDDKLTIEDIYENKSCIITFAERQTHTIEATVNNTDTGSAIVDKDIVYDGEDATISVIANDDYIYDSNDCGATYSNGILTLTNVTEDKVCKINFVSNVSSAIIDSDDDITNVQTGDETYIICFILVVAAVGVFIGYRKYSQVKL